MQRNRHFVEMTAMIGVHNRASGSFGVVQGIGRAAGLVEDCDRIYLRALRANEEVSTIIMQVEGGHFAPVGHGRPSAFVTDRRSGFSIAVCVSLDDRSRPMLLHDPLIKD